VWTEVCQIDRIRGEARRSSHRDRPYCHNGVKYSSEQCFTLRFTKFIGVRRPRRHKADLQFLTMQPYSLVSVFHTEYAYGMQLASVSHWTIQTHVASSSHPHYKKGQYIITSSLFSFSYGKRSVVLSTSNSIFLSHQISISHQLANNIFLLQQISTSHQPQPAEQSESS